MLPQLMASVKTVNCSTTVELTTLNDKLHAEVLYQEKESAHITNGRINI